MLCKNKADGNGKVLARLTLKLLHSPMEMETAWKEVSQRKKSFNFQNSCDLYQTGIVRRFQEENLQKNFNAIFQMDFFSLFKTSKVAKKRNVNARLFHE
jgi:hypothetical protein